MQKVIFRESDHTYWNQTTGEQYMSVTTFLGLETPFNEEEAVIKAQNSAMGKYRGWKKEDILEEWDRIRIEGTSLHKAIEEYLKGKDIKDIEESHRQAVYYFSQGAWKGKIYSETLLWSHTLKLAGTCDITSEWYNGDKRIINIFDIKTSSSLEYKMDKFSKQLWLYAALMEEMIKDEEEVDMAMFKENGIDLQPEEREIKAVGIIHYKDYLHNRKKKPIFVKVEDKRDYVNQLYKNKTLQSV